MSSRNRNFSIDWNEEAEAETGESPAAQHKGGGLRLTEDYFGVNPLCGREIALNMVAAGGQRFWNNRTGICRDTLDLCGGETLLAKCAQQTVFQAATPTAPTSQDYWCDATP